MTTNKKLVIAVVALSLALIFVIGGTVAFLIAETDPLTNTFTYGSISLKLTEEDKEEGMNFEGVMPGDSLNKKPVVTVTQGSESCFVYVLVDNQLGDAAEYNIDTEKWIPVGESGTKILYRYADVVDEEENLTVFETLTFDSGLEKDDLDALAGKNVVITAYAHQEANTDVATANEAAVIWAGVTAID